MPRNGGEEKGKNGYSKGKGFKGGCLKHSQGLSKVKPRLWTSGGALPTRYRWTDGKLFL